MDAIFLPTPDGERVFALWRGSKDASRVWLLCPPLAEEDKSARRTLSDIAHWLLKRDEASLLFSFQGTGDSSGDYAHATFAAWRTDFRTALAHLRQHAPQATIGVLGTRLGASLALLEAGEEDLGISHLVLIEPLLVGRQFLSQQAARKKMRAQLTANEANTSAVKPESQAQTTAPDQIEDFDGWPLGAPLRADFHNLDLRQGVSFQGHTVVLGVGPRSELAPPLQALAESLGATAEAVVMPAFWNLLDYSEPKPLLEALSRVLEGISQNEKTRGEPTL